MCPVSYTHLDVYKRQVNDGPLHRLQAILAANDQLHQRQDKVGFQRHRVFLVKAQVNVHRVDVVGAVRGDLDEMCIRDRSPRDPSFLCLGST